MINLLNELAVYLGPNLGLIPGKSIFYNSMPDEPAECLLIQSPKHHIPVPAQVNASSHYLRFTARGGTDASAYKLAGNCYKWIMQDVETYNVADVENKDLDGFIKLSDDLTVYIQPYGTPIWEKTDQRGRRYYTFTASLITKRIL